MKGKKIIDPLIRPGMTSSSSHVPSMYGDDFLELVWQNGEILMQGGSSPTSSSKTRKRPSCIEDPCITKRARLNTGTFYSHFDSSHQNSQHTNNDQHFTKSNSFSFSNKTGGDEFSNLREGSKGSNSCKPTTTIVGNTQLYYSSSSLSQYLGSDHQGINGKLNFSNFLRPALFVKSANLGNSATLPKNGVVSARAMEEMKTKESHSLNEHPHHEDQKALTSPIVAKSGNEETVLPDQHSEAIIKTQGSHAQTHHRAKGKSATQPYSNEPIVPSSSLCSLGASNDPNLHSRNHDQDTDNDSTYTSDNDEEPEDVIKQTPSREGSRGKKSRKAEIHNLSERKRRDKINKKMRALKELIPNCNKMDKASMLDDAIDYLKTLKLQLQVMSMGSGFCMPLMMLPSTGGGGGGGHHLLRPSGIGTPFSLPTHQFPNIPQLPSAHPTPITDNRLNMLAFQHPLMPLPFSPFLPMLPKNLPPNLSAHLTIDDSLLPNKSDLNAQLVGANAMQPSNNQGTNRK